MRLYIPSTSALIDSLVVNGEIDITIGFAVTPALREWYHAEDDEELEYIASLAAARASMQLLQADPEAKRRRAVLAVEVEDVRPIVGGDRAAVEVKSSLRLNQVESALVDDPDAQGEIEAALAVWDQATEDAHFAREQAQSHELLWFARQELPYIF